MKLFKRSADAKMNEAGMNDLIPKFQFLTTILRNPDMPDFFKDDLVTELRFRAHILELIDSGNAILSHRGTQISEANYVKASQLLELLYELRDILDEREAERHA